MGFTRGLSKSLSAVELLIFSVFIYRWLHYHVACVSLCKFSVFVAWQYLYKWWHSQIYIIFFNFFQVIAKYKFQCYNFVYMSEIEHDYLAMDPESFFIKPFKGDSTKFWKIVWILLVRKLLLFQVRPAIRIMLAYTWFLGAFSDRKTT